MRRVLRRIGTNQFVNSNGEDTEHFENGQPFAGFSDAANFCAEHDTKGVELVLLDEAGQEQVCLTLT